MYSIGKEEGEERKHCDNTYAGHLHTATRVKSTRPCYEETVKKIRDCFQGSHRPKQ